MNVAIVGYGNLGKAVEEVLLERKKDEIVAIFSRREVESKYKTKVVDIGKIEEFKGKIDVVFLTVGSFCDIEKIGVKIAENFCTVDSFDTHSKLKGYIEKLNEVARARGTVAMSAFGWDPGLMSLIRMIFQGVDERNRCESFWGKGVSQGHSDAIRRVEGVKNGIEYTVPCKEVFDKCRRMFGYVPKEESKHKRVCFVAKEVGASKDKIVKNIAGMENYFLGYDTKVVFEDEKTVEKKQRNLRHKGYVFKNFIVCDRRIKLQFLLSTASNPHLTASLMIMGAKAVKRLKDEKIFGAYSIMDVPMKYYFEDDKAFMLL